ncbi:prostatic acid phosphatase isoform X2 [Diabrotica virgifera virgifera]|uniref:Prostatic acid phosphatase-like isoform X2 n=1 Tax=Diabrotica virgifera virgifera TaxID=50390 RepID=A0A6P7F3L4_DIAVI|nr:prostatic acid phosphatase isoform X2 [Diabrotica virgifera virgifera]
MVRFRILGRRRFWLSMRRWTFICGTVTAMAAVLVFLGVGIKAIHVSGIPDRELKMVHIVMRHGARTPVSTYPNDPYKNDPLYPTGWGQLTNEGKKALYEIGKYYRERYGKFLGDKYSPDEYYTQSTDVDRTKASMMLVNAGLWPPKGEQVWGPLDWQPIPVASEPLSQDMLLLVRKPCPKYHVEKKKVFESKEVKDMLSKYEDLYKELTDITGQKTEDFEGVQDIYTTLMAEEKFHLKLPDWTKNYYPDRMYFPTVRSFVLNAYNDQMNRLIGGVLVKKLIEDWSAKSEGKLARKAVLYGGHDGTIVNLMSALKVWDEQVPDYAISILFELSKDRSTNEYGVEIYLRNTTVVPPFKLRIPGCDSFCPLTKLKELTKSIIPGNWEEECKVDDEGFVVPELRGP